MVYEAPNDDIEIQAPPPGTAYSFEASADVLAGQVVTVSGDNQVAPSTADGESVVGVSAQSVSAGDDVMVVGSGGRVRVTAGAAVTAGDVLASGGGTNDDGTVVTGALDNHVLGIAHEGAGAGETLIATVDTGGQVN